MIIKAPPSPSVYDLVYADPPWPQNKSYRGVRPNQIPYIGYPTMPVKDCIDYVEAFSNSHTNVFMWCIEKFLHDAEDEMQKRGWKLHARMIWNKENGVPVAFTIRFAHEYLLWFFKPGNMLKPVHPGQYSSVFCEKSTIHSRKPEIAYKMLEDMFPTARRIELFARRERPGWDAFGNEL